MEDPPCAEELTEALDGDALDLAYQPIVRLADGRVQGLEALLRWRRPGGEAVPAPVAVALAEDAGLIDRLGHWVLARALEDLALWRRTTVGRQLTVNVNLSALQLADPGLPREVNRRLALHDLPAEALVLELTETARMPEGAGRVLARLARLGVGVSIDDVGAGHATAMRVLGLPAREVKLEVAVLDRPSDGGGTYAGLVRRAVGVGLRGVVERIETPEQLGAAVAAGGTHVQGFLLGRPWTGEQVPWALRS